MENAPPRLEDTDPVLAEHLRLIANRAHPVVLRVRVQMRGITIFTRSGVHFKPTERNAPCPCGSGKKYKKCHLVCPCGSGVEFNDCHGQ